MSLIARIHGGMVFARRVRVLADHIEPHLPRNATVLDIGCGDGQLAALLEARRPDIAARGVDVLVRKVTAIPIDHYDGLHLPASDGAYDVALLIDVLHHADDPLAVLREAARVARLVVIKDHSRKGVLAGPTLRLMDWVGNARHGVALPYNYWSPAQWSEAFEALELEPSAMNRRLGLYSAPASWLFDRSLHFVAALRPRAVA